MPTMPSPGPGSMGDELTSSGRCGLLPGWTIPRVWGGDAANVPPSMATSTSGEARFGGHHPGEQGATERADHQVDGIPGAVQPRDLVDHEPTTNIVNKAASTPGYWS